MVQRDAPCLGQVQPAPAPLEQRLAEPLLQQANLRGERGLRDVQPLRRPGQMPFVRDHLEIAQVMIIEIRHIININRTEYA